MNPSTVSRLGRESAGSTPPSPGDAGGPAPVGDLSVSPLDEAPTAHGPRREDGGAAAVGRRLLELLAVSIATVAVGVVVATPDGSGYAQPVDDAVARWMAGHRPHLLVMIAEAASALGAVVPMALLVALAGWWLLRRTGRWALALMPLASLLAAQVVVRLTKVVVGRPRPAPDLAAMHAAGMAFPSGHATTAAAAATALALGAIAAGVRPRRVAPAAAAAALLIAGSRIVLGVHWLSDVVAGLLLGAAIAAILRPRRQDRGRPRGGAPVRPRVDRAPLAAPRSRRWWSSPRHAGTTLGVLAAVGLLAGVCWSYGHALTAPGRARWDARTVEWLRDHQLSGVVDRAESWWLWHHLPSTNASLTALPTPGGSAAAPPLSPTTSLLALPDPVPTLLHPALPGEGAWTAAEVSAAGNLQIATTVFRPDPAHPSVMVALAWMDPAAVRFTLVAGTREPGGGVGAWGATVPAEQRPNLLAAFNSGYRMRDTPGGALVEGHQIRTFLPGLATLVVRADGSATVGQWGRDVGTGPDVVAARQNLRLVVDDAQLVDGLRQNVGGRWGTVRNALPTWRSGIGVDAAGHLIYTAGNQLTLDVLARSLQQAGAVRAMELDIHDHMVTYNMFGPSPRGTGEIVGRKLLPAMTESANRYLIPDQRDFVAVLAR